MNKTVNINIGGLFFHIDEDAYQKLQHYFSAVKQSLSDPTGQDEIMKDIEMRVAELLMEKQKSDKHVVNLKDVEEVIAVMGEPEDYRIESNNKEEPLPTTYYSKRKKLYRDADRGIIGGVCSGLGHYIGIDAVWIRLLFFLLAFTSFGVIAYIIFWISTPKAITTSEKLEMQGEPVTISNIEKKVREEFDTVSKRFKDVDYDKMGTRVKTGTEKVVGGLGEIISNVFKLFIKILGAFIIIFSALTLTGLLIALFTVGSTSFIDNPFQQYIMAYDFTIIPIWLLSLLFFLAIGIPFFFFLILGLKLLISHFKAIGAIAIYSLIAVWVIAVGILSFIGIKHASEKAFEGKTIIKEVIHLQNKDTLLIRFVNNDYFSKDVYDTDDFKIVQDSLKNEMLYSNNIRLEFKKTEAAEPYVQIQKTAEGKSYAAANGYAEKINYGFKIIGNELILDNYFLTDIRNKYRNQEVMVYIYLPKGTLFKANENVDYFNRTDDDFFNYEIKSDSTIFQMENNQIKCLNCLQEDEDNENEDRNKVKSVSIKINGEEFIKVEDKKIEKEWHHNQEKQ